MQKGRTYSRFVTTPIILGLPVAFIGLSKQASVFYFFILYYRSSKLQSTPKSKAYFTWVMVSGLILFFAFRSYSEPNNQECFECHTQSDIQEQLLLSEEDFNQSVHRLMDCRICHRSSETCPGLNFDPEAYERDECMDCHYKDYKSIERIYNQSIHETKYSENFNCTTCHNPHTMPSKETTDIPEIVDYDNTICLDCHQNINEFLASINQESVDQDLSHDFLPNREAHWKYARCADCHTPQEDETIHHIQKEEEAQENCVGCHSRESMLMIKLYKPAEGEPQTVLGFVNKNLFQNAYVIGATGNKVLDFILGLILALILYGVIGHAIVRLIARFKVREVSYEVKQEFIYKLNIRIWHWTNAILFLLLIVSGFTMHFATAYITGSDFKLLVNIHNYSGIVLMLLYLIYLIVLAVNRDYKHYIPSKDGLFKRLYNQARYYAWDMFLGKPHPYKITRESRFNPLQRFTYFPMMFLMFPLLCITGIMMLFPESAPDQVLGYGGIWPVAIVHYLLAAAFTLFLIVHIYLGTTGDKVKYLFQAMINGYHRHHEQTQENNG